MARLLFRLGQSAAHRAWTVIAAWIAIVALAGGAFVTFGGTLATTFSIPGTETTRVTDRIVDEMGEATGATGTVVFASDEELNSTQREQITDLVGSIAQIDGVDTVVDPFDTQSEQTEQEQQLADGREQLEAAQQEIADSAEELAAGRAQLEGALQQAEQAGPEAVAQLESQREELDAGEEELEAGRS